jgi:outer membrane receptor for Fe3+-dicitrate
MLGYQAFVQASSESIWEKLKISMGLNVSGNNYNRNMKNPLNQLAPRLSATYNLSEKWNVNANVGRYAMQPSYTTLGYRDKQGTLVNRNENLRHIVSNQAILGLEYRPVDKMRLSVEAFYKLYDHYTLSVVDGISMASKGTDYGQVGDEEIVSSGKGRAYGIEFLFKIVDMNKMNLNLSTTLFRSEFTNREGKYLPSSWDTRQITNLTANYRLPNNWELSLRQRVVGGMPYTPINESYSSLKQVWDIRHQPYPDYARFNSQRLRTGHILDVRVDKEFYFKKWLLNVYTDIQNLYNFRSEMPPIYTNLDRNGNPVSNPTDPNRYQLRVIETFGGTILPTVGIIVKM